MKLVGAGYQGRRDFGYYADGLIASTSLPQLILPEHPARSSLIFQNTSNSTMWVGMGSARATCTISSGQVNSVSVANAGFGFTRAPIVEFLGGGLLPQQGQYPSNSSYVGAPGPSFPAPSHTAQAHCVMTGSPGALTVQSIVIDDPGYGYVVSPFVFIANDVLDPNGCFDPSANSGSGFRLLTNQVYGEGETVVSTDALAVFCATLSATYACRFTP